MKSLSTTSPISGLRGNEPERGHMRSISACGLVSLAVLVGCSDVTGPVVALGPNGAKMTGTATGRINGVGDIVISGPYGRCVGNYDSLDTSPTIPISLLCEDGTSTIGSA